jgi:hydrogenase expression/formation protein HypC
LSCEDPNHCVTCSDEGVPMRVREVRADGIALADDGTELMIDLVAPVGAGDEVLVHAGVALARLA